MDGVAAKLAQLQDRLESTAFLVSQGGSAKEAHSEIVRGLVILSDVQRLYSGDNSGVTASDQNSNEISKIKRRLKLWTRRQSQINSRILNAFLELEQSGMSAIKEADLKNKLPDVSSFESNFAQMKIIAEKNHGKIFEQLGDEVTLWKPAIPYVRKYENALRGG